jgi:hypothetical protein
MTSMDDVYERMQIFARELAEFQDALTDSLADLRRCHEAIDSLWQDEARRHYDALYGPLRDMLERYLRHQVPAYQTFLREKLRALEGYLFGSSG